MGQIGLGLGKPRTTFGRWLDVHGIRQQRLSMESGVSEDVITRLANVKNSRPSWRTEKKLMKVLRQYDSEIVAKEFWGT